MTFPQGDNATRVWMERFRKPYLALSCGDHSYGRPSVECAPSDVARRLEVGRYCSFGAEVVIFVGRQGRHALDTLTTYPLLMAVSEEAAAARGPFEKPATPTRTLDRDLDTIIGHDVWVGLRAIILAGVTIGTGAVVGAGAVVTRDVEPYSIVGGAPATHVKYRHAEDVRRRLLASEWWSHEPDDLFRRLGWCLQSADLPGVLAALERP